METTENLKVEISSKRSCIATTASTCHVVAMPYPGRGHVNPMMNLCKLITLKKPDILFTFVVTEEWHSFISSYKKPPNIQFRTIPNVIPSELGRAKDLPAFQEAVSTKMESPFEQVLDGIKNDGFPINAIIADTFLYWVVKVGNRRNIPVASLWTMSATSFSLFYHFDLILQHGHFPIKASERREEVVDYIPGIPPTRLADLPTSFDAKDQILLPRALKRVSMVSEAQFLLFSGVYELESQVIDALKFKFPFPVLALGPAIPYFELESTNFDQTIPDYINWLNAQPKHSVLYVSMGSFLSVSSTQMEEIIAGICSSGVRFLWVSRGEIVEFKDGYGEMGFVVPWCDQLRVLNHPSIGGFWTHCGFNSTLEAVFSGIPILASPIFSDQTTNCKIIVEDWKIGCRVFEGGKLGDGLVTRQQIAKLVKDIMDPGKSEAIEIRQKAKLLKQVCQAAIAKGGSTHTNFDSFIKDISQVHTN